MSLVLGRTITVDLSGLQSLGLPAGEATGTVVALDPGAITIRLERDGEPDTELTVSPGRVLSR